MASGFGVQTFVVGAGALVLGLVLGGLGPRAELRDAKQDLFDAQKKCASSGSAQAGAELARMLTEGMERRRGEQAAAGGSAGAAPDGGPDGARSVVIGDEPGGDLVRPGEGGPREGDDQVALTSEMLALRSQQARAALVEDADPSPEQLKEIDAAVADMNDQLLQTVQEFADRASQGPVSRRDMMTFGAETLDLFVSAEDRMLNSLSLEQRAAVRDEATDPTSFVDPQIVAVVKSLSGALEKNQGAP
jgi:hypothetical protein